MSCDICKKDGESWCWMGHTYCDINGCQNEAKQATDPGIKPNNRRTRRQNKQKPKFKKRFGGR